MIIAFRWTLGMLLALALAGWAAVSGCSSSDAPGPIDSTAAGDGAAVRDGGADLSGDGACVRPTISTTHLDERCDGADAVDCMPGQSCRAKVSPSVPPPPKYCLISSTDDCACPAGYTCLPSTSGGPVPYCVTQP